MTEATQHVTAGPAEVETEESHRPQTGLFEDKSIEQLSQTLRTRARVVRQHNSNAYLYHRSELAVWLGEDGHLVDEALEFMHAKGWAGKFGLPDTWWITYPDRL